MSAELVPEFAIRLGDGTIYGNPKPLLWASYGDAERALCQLCRVSTELGVSLCGARIVHRMTTPFTDRDNLFDIAHPITAWASLMGME